MKKVKRRRRLLPSDFRRNVKHKGVSRFGILSCGEYGWIDVAGLYRDFPDEKERLAYIDALIEGMS